MDKILWLTFLGHPVGCCTIQSFADINVANGSSYRRHHGTTSTETFMNYDSQTFHVNSKFKALAFRLCVRVSDTRPRRLT